MHINFTIVSIQLNVFNYCYLTQIILFNINDLFAESEMIKSIAIEHYSFAHRQMVLSIAM